MIAVLYYQYVYYCYKVHTIELGSAIPSSTVPRLSSSDLKFALDKLNEKKTANAKNSHSIDFPISIQVFIY